MKILAFITDPPVVFAIMPSPGLCREAITDRGEGWIPALLDTV